MNRQLSALDRATQGQLSKFLVLHLHLKDDLNSARLSDSTRSTLGERLLTFGMAGVTMRAFAQVFSSITHRLVGSAGVLECLGGAGA